MLTGRWFGRQGSDDSKRLQKHLAPQKNIGELPENYTIRKGGEHNFRVFRTPVDFNPDGTVFRLVLGRYDSALAQQEAARNWHLIGFNEIESESSSPYRLFVGMYNCRKETAMLAELISELSGEPVTYIHIK